MRTILVFIAFLMLFGICDGKNKWKDNAVKLPAHVCYATNEVHKSFVPPSAEYYQHLKSATLKKTTIEVSYVGFSLEAQQAFQYAVEIWQNLIYSPVPIRIKAYWKSLDKGVLGSCGPSEYYSNFNSTQVWDRFYPVALVEKMLGEEVNAKTEFEISGSFNKDFTNWYFGTDGNTPADKYDFVSTVLHELTHGLGFSGFFYSNRGRAGYDYSGEGIPAIFDQFVQNKDGNQLVNTSLFANPSVKLYQNLTSGWLEFNTKLAGNQLPRLYAPTTWDDGSSVYHLNEATYPAGDSNSLMTPFSGMGEAIHDPGSNTLSIMEEMGWKTVSIRHSPLKDIEFLAEPIFVDAAIVSDYDLDSTRLFLVYSTNKFAKSDSLQLLATQTPDMFDAELPKSLSGEVDYYFSAQTANGKKYFFPSNAPSRYLNFKIGIDHELPVVTHEPVKYLLTSNPSAKIDVVAIDNIGIKSVKLEYFINGGVIKSFTLSNDTLNAYSGYLTFQKGSVKSGDVISYRIVATDVSSQSNQGTSPATGFYTFKIEGSGTPVERYVNDFNSATQDFIGTDFTISTVSGFDSPALNSAHPYLSPDQDNTTLNFRTILKYPVILKEGGKMSYDEIALVEPGDSGTVFGDENFFDYVIVEGSKDGGITWKPLVDGYDCRAQKSWENLFNSTITGNNSTGVPTKDLIVNRQIDLLALGSFNAGDTIQIGFRLFSDPYSHGWGWMIDNLAIQDYGTLTETALSSGEVEFFPNPASNKLEVRISSRNKLHNLFLKAYNSAGILVYTKSYSVDSKLFHSTIDVTNFVSGLYLFTVEPENEPVITRKILVK